MLSSAPRAESGGEPMSLTVYFDGACPLCRREIDLYRGLKARLPLNFADISSPEFVTPGDVPHSQLLARFHVRAADGGLLSGAEAFVALWAVLPGWRWLAALARLPGATWAMERLYRLFLRWRPALQGWAFRLDGRRPAADSSCTSCRSSSCDIDRPR